MKALLFNVLEKISIAIIACAELYSIYCLIHSILLSGFSVVSIFYIIIHLLMMTCGFVLFKYFKRNKDFYIKPLIYRIFGSFCLMLFNSLIIYQAVKLVISVSGHAYITTDIFYLILFAIVVLLSLVSYVYGTKICYKYDSGLCSSFLSSLVFEFCRIFGFIGLIIFDVFNVYYLFYVFNNASMNTMTDILYFIGFSLIILVSFIEYCYGSKVDLKSVTSLDVDLSEPVLSQNDVESNYEHTRPSADERPARNFKTDRVQANPEQALQNLIGLDAVKRRVLEIKAVLSYDKANGLKNSQSYNMMFLGAPGTGKTTVARIMAAMLYELGVVHNNIFLELNATEMMGEYLGQTPRIVTDAFKAAAGGVLFIDEAYAFAKSVGGSGSSSFGDEAIITLLSKIEQNSDGTVVIFAGYKNEMDDFLAMNQGLRSRIPYAIDFPDYTVDEMIDILAIELAKYKHHLTADATKLISNTIEAVKLRAPIFENGRYARNLAQSLHTNHALNVYNNTVNGTDIVSVDVNVSDLIGLSSAKDCFTLEEIDILQSGDSLQYNMDDIISAVQFLGITDASNLDYITLEKVYTNRLNEAQSIDEKNMISQCYKIVRDFIN